MPPTKAPSKRERRAQRIGLRYPIGRYVTSGRANVDGLHKMIFLVKNVRK